MRGKNKENIMKEEEKKHREVDGDISSLGRRSKKKRKREVDLHATIVVQSKKITEKNN